MSGTHFWPSPDEIGWHSVDHSDGEKRSLWWNGKKWSDDQFAPWQRTTEQVREMGYLGVRREKPEPVRVRFLEVTELQPTPRAVGDDDPYNDAIAAQALAEWRDVKQSPKAADWAYRWAHRLCVILGAE